MTCCSFGACRYPSSEKRQIIALADRLAVLESLVIKLRAKRDALGEPPTNSADLALWTAKERRYAAEIQELATERAALATEKAAERAALATEKAAEAAALATEKVAKQQQALAAQQQALAKEERAERGAPL